jgi:hypothetical protein
VDDQAEPRPAHDLTPPRGELDPLGHRERVTFPRRAADERRPHAVGEQVRRLLLDGGGVQPAVGVERGVHRGDEALQFRGRVRRTHG